MLHQGVSSSREQTPLPWCALSLGLCSSPCFPRIVPAEDLTCSASPLWHPDLVLSLSLSQSCPVLAAGSDTASAKFQLLLPQCWGSAPAVLVLSLPCVPSVLPCVTSLLSLVSLLRLCLSLKERMRREREAATQQLEEEAEVSSTGEGWTGPQKEFVFCTPSLEGGGFGEKRSELKKCVKD